ncbi:hypothetical protein BDV3_004774 [Batrachochytrium dendrobatidis]
MSNECDALSGFCDSHLIISSNQTSSLHLHYNSSFVLFATADILTLVQVGPSILILSIYYPVFKTTRQLPKHNIYLLS